MPPKDAVRIRHMIDAAENAQRFIEGRQRADLDTNIMLVFALMRAIEIVGEAATKISPETRLATPTIPWAAIIAMRNRLIHAYFDIDHDILWQTVTEDISGLLRLLHPLLPID